MPLMTHEPRDYSSQPKHALPNLSAAFSLRGPSRELAFRSRFRFIVSSLLHPVMKTKSVGTGATTFDSCGRLAFSVGWQNATCGSTHISARLVQNHQQAASATNDVPR